MSFSTNWDIEQYRVSYESEEHWALREKFLLKHKNKYPEEKLVCLTQVFYNVEFLGCRYPKATMKLVETLSQGIVEDHREKMKNRLKRTFVGASDAASSKVKGLKRPAAAVAIVDLGNKSDSVQTTSATIKAQVKKPKNVHIRFEPAEDVSPSTAQNETPNQEPMQSTSIELEPTLPDTILADTFSITKKKNKKKKKGGSIDDIIPEANEPQVLESPEVAEPVTRTMPDSYFKKLVLSYRKDDSPDQKIQSSCAFNKVPFEIKNEVVPNTDMYKSFVSVCGVEVGTGCGPTSSLAQFAAASNAVYYLSKQCYTILIKNPFFEGKKVEKHEIIDCQQSISNEPVSDNKASRMMMMMGWSGGGLGKEEQGRLEPVVAVQQARRTGVGSTSGQVKISRLKQIFQDFIRSGSTHDLVFSTDFDSEERKEIHSCAHKFGLVSRSRAKGQGNRFLVVSRKWEPQVLLSVLRDSGIQSEKYQLVPPQ